MKKLMNLIKVPLVALLAIMLATLPVHALTVSSSPAVAATNNLVATAGSITSITLSGANAPSVKVALFDASTNTLTYIIGAYTNYTINVFTNTSTYVDILGGTNTNSFKFWTNVPTAVIQTTNQFRIIATFSVPTNESVVIQYDTANPFFRGITMTNSQGISATINYLPWK